MIEANRVKDLAINRGKRLLIAQDRLLRTPERIKAIFGGWGSGKTRGAALAFLANCLANPHRRHIHGNDHPFSLVIGITHKVLKDSAHRELMDIMPPELIRWEKKSPDWELLLENGHIIKFRTVKGALEGASACAAWLDEAHLLTDDLTYLNYQIRVRDPRGERFLVLVSGLPEDGWLRETFENDQDPDRLTIYARTQDNIYLPDHVIRQYKASASNKNRVKYLDGEWMPKEGLCYFEYTYRHRVSEPGLKSKITHISFDIGNKGVVLFLQEFPVRLHDGTESLKLRVVDEINPEKTSVKMAMRLAKQRGWNISERRSIVFTDPTVRSDELRAVREELGEDIRIIYQKRGDDKERVEYGIDCVNAALCDSEGNTRLEFFDGLPRDSRSLLTVITRYHRNPKTGRPVRDDTVDHACDALRYPVAHFFPLLGSKHRVWSKRDKEEEYAESR